MYSKITNPKTGAQVQIKSKLGKRILRNYLNVLSGGAHLDGEGGPAERWEIHPSLVTPDRMETWEETREHHSSAQTEALRIMAQCVETSIGLKLAALYIPTEEDSYPESLHRALNDALHINPAEGDRLKIWLKEVFTLHLSAEHTPSVPEWWQQTYSHLPPHDTINIHCSIVMNIIHLILVARPFFPLEDFYLMGATIAAMVLPEGSLADWQITSLIPRHNSHEVASMKVLILTIINVDPCCDRDCSHISPTLSARLAAVDDEETQDWSPTNGWVDDIRGRDVPGERIMVDLPFGDPDDEHFITVEYPQQWSTIDADGGIRITDPR